MIVSELLRTTLADMVSLLRRERVSYALVGGLAVSLRGQPRVTVDVDILVVADVERAARLVSIFEESNFQPLFANVMEVVERAFILPVRHRSTNVKVDLILGLSGFERQTVTRAEPLDLAGSTVSVATAEDLIIMKVLAGRPQDEQDLQGLVMAGSSSRLGLLSGTCDAVG